MAEKFVSGIYDPAQDHSLSRRRLIDGIRDAEEVREFVAGRKQFRNRFKSPLTPPVRRAMRRATADLGDEPPKTLPL